MKKKWILVSITVAAVLAYWLLFSGISADELDAFIRGFGPWAPLAYVAAFTVLPAFFFPVAVLALAGGGAVLYYFKFRKSKADTTGHDDLDEYDFGEDEDADEEPAEIEIHSEDGQEDET